jgi:hypothetical protein
VSKRPTIHLDGHVMRVDGWTAYIETPDGEAELNDPTLDGLTVKVDKWGKARRSLVHLSLTVGHNT